jgi:tetratricopeptide (TPR) repeat protein
MKRRLLPLLLAACCASASAAETSLCAALPLLPNDDAIAQAKERLAAAKAAPSEGRLDVADASVVLASAILRRTGQVDVGLDGGPPPFRLVQDALVIWSQARPDAALVRRIQAAEVPLLNAHQCRPALSVLQAAASAAQQAGGDGLAIGIAHDTLRVALALNDAAAVRSAAPRWTAALQQLTSPLGLAELDVVFDLLAFDYRNEDNAGAEQLAQRALALLPRNLPSSPASARRLNAELASIYYAQLRFAEGEALRASLVTAKPAEQNAHAEFTRRRDALAAQVRSGDLLGAGTGLESALPAYERALETARSALAAAEGRQAALQADPATMKNALAQAARDAAGARGLVAASAMRLAELLDAAGEIEHAQGRLDAAIAFYERALATLNKDQAAGSVEAARFRSDLALALHARGKAAQALVLQEQVLQVLLPLYGAAHPDVREAQAELAALRKETGR